MAVKYVKTIAIVVGVVFALFGAWQFTGSLRNLYGDWVFLRQARITTLQNQQRQAAQQQQAAQKPAPKPAPIPDPEAAEQ